MSNLFMFRSDTIALSQTAESTITVAGSASYTTKEIPIGPYITSTDKPATSSQSIHGKASIYLQVSGSGSLTVTQLVRPSTSVPAVELPTKVIEFASAGTYVADIPLIAMPYLSFKLTETTGSEAIVDNIYVVTL